jgi:hypothetical protein
MVVRGSTRNGGREADSVEAVEPLLSASDELASTTDRLPRESGSAVARVVATKRDRMRAPARGRRLMLN